MSEANEEVGSVAEEAARLFGALGGVLGDEAAGHGPGDHERPAECRYCPLCRLIRLLDEASPQARQQLTTAAVSLVEALGALLAAVDTARDEGGEPGRGPEGGRARGRAGSSADDPIEHIDLGEDEDEADWQDLG